MHRPHSELVQGKDGLRGTILRPSSRDTTQVIVQLATGQQLWVPAEVLVRQQDGSYYLPLSPADVEPYTTTPHTGGVADLDVSIYTYSIYSSLQSLASISGTLLAHGVTGHVRPCNLI